jgi:DNA gyrase subunit B
MLGQQQSEYTASDIQVLEGLEAVRRRPGMYIGSTDERGLHHLAYEVVDNAIDEAMAGFCDQIVITMRADGSMLVTDNGRGIPVDIHATTGRSALETIMTTLHAGAKFAAGAYRVSGGLHGVGSSVVNALSAQMRVEVRRDGRLYYQEYEKGKPLADVMDAGPLPENEASNTGTTVWFIPDETVFGEARFSYDTLLQRFREMAYLNKGVHISLVNEFDSELNKTFYYEGGIASFVQHLNHNREVLQPEPFYVEKAIDSTVVELALQYNTGFYESTLAFANCINTVDGGTHLMGFRSGLTRAINSYTRKQKLVKDDAPNFAGEDVREGLTAIVSVKLADPQFEGQTKGKLGNADTKGHVESVIVQHLEFYLEEHPQEARRIVEKCLVSQKARDAARKARDLVIRKNAMDGGSLPGKLADCSERNPELCELFVVEGESAGGSAKMGRDRQTQAILPLKGKILNVEKARPDQMLGHEEIRALITAIGAGLGEDFNLEKLRYHKIIIMTDADVDGAHIRTLLLTFFFRNMRQLIDHGHLFIAQPPLYRVSKGRSFDYKYAEADKDKWMANQHYGRMSIFSKDESVRVAGAALQDLVTKLKEFQGWAASLEGLGLPSDLIGYLLKGAVEHHYELEFQGRESLKLLKEWFEANGIASSFDSGGAKTPTVLDIEGFGKLNLERLYSAPALLQSLQLYPSVAEFVNGKRYTVTKRDAELAQEVAWYELVALLERQAERSGIGLQRYKGLGEMNPDQLWDTTMDPKVRTMLGVSVEDAAGADELFYMLMGDVVAPRREFIEAHAQSVKNLDI